MLSSISKIADKPFVIGFLLPSLMFAIVLVGLFPLPPWAQSIVEDLHSENPFANLTYVVLGIWLIATILLLLNYDIYRCLEGYTAPMKWFTWCQRFHRWHHKRLLDDANKAKDAGKPTAGTLRIALLDEYPLDPHYILPTAFGNVLRSFEQYSWDVYGADGVALWPRLVAVLPKDFIGQMDDARSQVDFPVNLCVLSWIVAAIAAGELVVQARQLHFELWSKTYEPFAVDIAAALAISWLLYRWATHALGGWGETVKAAWDCYLPALATQLAYVLPDNEVDRKVFWRRLSAHFTYRREFPKDFNPIEPAKATAPWKARPTDEKESDLRRDDKGNLLMQFVRWVAARVNGM